MTPITFDVSLCELMVSKAGTMKMPGKFEGNEAVMTSACVHAWAKRFGGTTPMHNAASTIAMIQDGGACICVTRQNKKSFQFTIVPMPATVQQIFANSFVEVNH